MANELSHSDGDWYIVRLDDTDFGDFHIDTFNPEIAREKAFVLVRDLVLRYPKSRVSVHLEKSYEVWTSSWT